MIPRPLGCSRIILGALAALVAVERPALAANPTTTQPAGDFVHVPAPEQKVNTPLPVFAKSGDDSLQRVFVRFKGPTTADWSHAELKRMAGGWGGLIPCEATTVGVVRYFLQGYDAVGDLVANSGDRAHPFSVPVREEITSAAPRLPEMSPPRACDDDAEEAPAPTAATGDKRGTDEADERPSPPNEAPDESPHAYASLWIGVSGSAEWVSMPGASDVCILQANTQPTNPAGYYCTNPVGTDFPTRTSGAQNASLVPGSAGSVAGGIRPGDVRVSLAVDYAVTSSILVGVRLGTVGNGYPGAAAVSDGRAFSSHVHVEARGTYLFGRDPLGSLGFSPMVFAAAGAAEFDGHATTVVAERNIAGETPVVAWVTNGPWFLAVGGGVRYQFSRRTAFTGAFRVNAAFGGIGALFTFGPEIAFQYGL